MEPRRPTRTSRAPAWQQDSITSDLESHLPRGEDDVADITSITDSDNIVIEN